MVTRPTPVLVAGCFALVWVQVVSVHADDRSAVKIRLATDLLEPARSGTDYAGVIEITAPHHGVLDHVEIDGDGWRALPIELGVVEAIAPGDRLRVPFRAKVLDESKPLTVRVTFDGHTRTKRFDLSPDRFARQGKDRPAVRLESSGDRGKPKRGDGDVTSGACEDQLIHFSGRIAYNRPGVDNSNPPDGDFDDLGTDNSNPPDGDFDDPGDVPPDVPPALVGADRIWFEVMDDDLIDEAMVSSYTNEDGSFDVTICWDDCDISGCDDPDIYLRFECDTDIVNVQDGYDILEEDYSWSTEQSQYFPDYTGHDIDFGTVLPGDAGEYPAIHIHNTITRAHRFIVENDGAYIDQVDAQWPEDNTEYNSFFEEIYIEVSEQWNEATQTHEWGHHLLHEWTEPGDGDYCNGFCDDDSGICGGGQQCEGDGSHCVWCRENVFDAWNEGFPNWLGSVAVRGWRARYSIVPWTQLNGLNGDGRYTLEMPQNCCDGTSHDPWITEGFVGALLRDIEDPSPEVPGVNPITCPQDSIDLTPGDILTVVRQTRPNRMVDFLQAFWAAHQEHAHDVRNAALAVAPAYGGLWPTPPIEIYQTSGCGTAQAGEPISLQVETNGSTYSLNMRWSRDGVPLSDSTNRTGSFTDTLTINSATTADAGSYTLVISSCDGTQMLTSAPIPVFVFGDGGRGYRVTGWGRDAYGSLGRGMLNPPDYLDVNPGDVVNLDNVVDVSAGYWNAVALLADGTVRSWGAYYLGDGTANNSATPVTVSGLSNVVAVSAGGYESCMALDADGHVWTWGSNFYGQIGDGSGQWRLAPVQVPGLSCVVDISMGAYSVAAVTADGSLWTWGNNGDGALGIGSFGGWYTTPQLVPGLDDVVEAECGWTHIIARRSDGTVWCSGSNAQGQLGDGTFTYRHTFGKVPGLSDVISVKAGALHSLAIRSDQTPWAWGFNGFGQLGTNALTGNVSNPVRPANPPTVRSLDGGYYNSLFVATDGTIWTCGYWGSGALGRPGTDFAPKPVDLRVGAAVKASAGVDFMMVIAPGARITAPVPDRLAAGCAAVELGVEAIGEPPLNFRWRKDGIPLNDGGSVSGATGPVLTISPSEIDDTGSYDVLVWNDENVVGTDAATLVTPPLLQTFDAGQDPAAWWNNERGAWTVVDGVYAAGVPSLSPASYNSFDLPLTDFSIELDVSGASSGGVWLRSRLGSPEPIGVLLAFHDAYPPLGTAELYWTRWHGLGYQSPEAVALSVFDVGEDIHLRVEVRGNSYTAYLNDLPTPTTQFTTAEFPNGRLGLWDNAAINTAFDNIFIQTLPNCNANPGLTPPSVIQRPLSQVVTDGTPIVLSVVATGSGPLEYQWLRDGECIPGADMPDYLIIAAQETEGRYECTVSNACGAVGSFPAMVSLDGRVPGDIDGDGEVGLADLGVFVSCMLGPDVPHAPDCSKADLDADGDVDLIDLGLFQSWFAG